MSTVLFDLTETQKTKIAKYWQEVLAMTKEYGMAKKCKTCLGHGLWFDGSGAPVGPMDAEDGIPTIPCPECGANTNPTGKVKSKGVTEDDFIKDITK